MIPSRLASLLVLLPLLGGVAAPALPAGCTPRFEGSWIPPDNALGVDVEGSLAVVAAAQAGLFAVDVSNPGAPTLLGSVEVPDRAGDVELRGNLAFVACADGKFATVDLANPAAPRLLGGFDTLDFAAGLDVVGNLAFVAAKTAGLWILDVSDPSAPREVARWNSPGYARNVVVEGGLAYLADWHAGVWILDVSEPSSPYPVAGWDTPGRAVGLAFGEGILFVADDTGGIESWDVSTPWDPHLLANASTPDEAIGLDLVGDRLFLACAFSGLLVYDVSNPAAPKLLGSSDTLGYSYDVVVRGGKAFLAAWSDGLRILDVSSCIPVAPPVAAFRTSPSNPKSGRPVRFEDLSTGDPTGLAWDFGDGSTGSGGVVEHVYLLPGRYGVRLTATNAGGSSTATADLDVVCPLPCPTAPRLILPGAARAPGANGTYWRSDLELFNPWPDPIDLSIGFVPFDAAVVPLPFGLHLGAKETRLLPDVLSWFSLFGEQPGFLRIATVSIDPQALPLAALSTYNDAATGHFGQRIPATADGSSSTAGAERWLAGLRVDASFRTNLGVVNLGDEPLTVVVEGFAPGGEAIGSLPVDLPPEGARQLPLAGPGWDGAGPFSVRVRRLAGGAFDCWASRVDNRSGDPTFVPGGLDRGLGRVLGGLASTPGANGTRWRSRLLAANPRETATTVPLRFHSAGSAAQRDYPLAIPAHGSVEIDDCLPGLFGFENDWGFVEIGSDGTGNDPVLFASTWNDAATGSYGQTIPPISNVEDLLNCIAPWKRAIVGVARGEGVRTNLGVWNHEANPLVLSIRLLVGSQLAVGPAILELPGGAARLLDPFSLFPGAAPEIFEASLVLEANAGATPIVFASRIDNRSGDPEFLVPESIPGSEGGAEPGSAPCASPRR
jgi:hypothetical protein